jgi:plasmid stability protein
MSTKVTVNLPDETVAAMKNIAAARGTTVTEALRQVIETQSFLDSETQKGNNLLIQDPTDKSLRQIVFNTTLKGASNTKA